MKTRIDGHMSTHITEEGHKKHTHTHTETKHATTHAHKEENNEKAHKHKFITHTSHTVTHTEATTDIHRIITLNKQQKRLSRTHAENTSRKHA